MESRYHCQRCILRYRYGWAVAGQHCIVCGHLLVSYGGLGTVLLFLHLRKKKTHIGDTGLGSTVTATRMNSLELDDAASNYSMVVKVNSGINRCRRFSCPTK
jgi:hypothetical protein